MSAEKPTAETAADRPSRGFWSEAWHRFRRRRLSMIALGFVCVLAMIAMLAPVIVGTKPLACRYDGKTYFPVLGYYNSSWEPTIFKKRPFRGRYGKVFSEEADGQWAVWPLVYQDPYRAVREEERPGQPGNPGGFDGRPNRWNLLGTDQRGVDVFAQMVHGTQIALSVGFISTGIAALIGVTVGAMAGYFGSWVDVVLSRLIEVVMCVPSLVLILALIAIIEEVSNWHLMVVVGITSWTGIARLTRGEFLRLREMDYVTAARAIGVRPSRIIFRHILRNALAPVLVPVSFGIAAAILIESGLSYLGFGAAPPNPSWGTLLRSGRDAIQQMWWLILYPGVAIFLTVLAYNLIGEGLQEATDPRLTDAD